MEPISRYSACLLVQNLLIFVHNIPYNRRKCAFTKAWTSFSFDSTYLWQKYLQKQQHLNAPQSVYLCTTYLEQVYTLLLSAHLMYTTVQMSDALTGPRRAPENVVAMAANELGFKNAADLKKAVAKTPKSVNHAFPAADRRKAKRNASQAGLGGSQCVSWCISMFM